MAILDLNNVQESSKPKYLSELTLDDLFLEVNYKNNTRSIILCRDKQFKILKKWGKPPKESKLYDVAYLNKIVASF